MKKLTIAALVLSFIVAFAVSWKALSASMEADNPQAEVSVSAMTEQSQTPEPEPELIEIRTVFDKGTTLNGKDIGGLSVDETIAEFEAEFNAKTISIVLRDGTSEDYPYFALNNDFKGFKQYVQDLFDSMAETGEYELTEDISEGLVDISAIECIKSENCVPAEDAYLSVNVKKGTAEIVPETAGTVLEQEKIAGRLIESIRSGKPEVTFEDEDYVSAKVTSDDEDLVKQLEYAKLVLNRTLKVKVCGVTETLDKKTIRSFLKYSDGFSVDKNKLTEYVNSLKAKYDTCGVPRNFHTSTGEDVVITRGTYGWLIDAGKSVTNLTEVILSTEKETSVNAAYSVKGQRPATDEFAGNYIEVSIEHQKIWMYVDGVCIVADDVTTGDATIKGKSTRLGMFFLKYKQSPAVLKGSDYREDVSYWMDYDGNIGVHDATWRTEEEFGGTNYIGNGSHGCVNCRLATAEIIYNNWKADVPIIVW